MINMSVKFDESEKDEFQKELETEIDKQIYDVADRIFAISQNMVPVAKGTLKKSGNIRYGRGYAFIGYNTPYAEDIHDGHQAHDRVVRQHTRMLQSGIVVSVRSHIRHMNESTGRPYLDDAIKEVLRNLPEEVRDSISISRMEVEF